MTDLPDIKWRDQRAEDRAHDPFEQLADIVFHMEVCKNFCILAERLSTDTIQDESILMIEAVVYMFNPQVSKKLMR